MIRTRKDRLVVTLLLLAIALFISLGIWQLQRRTWKLELIARVDVHIHQPAAPLPAPNDWPGVNEHHDAYRHVTVRGRFLHEKEAYVQASTTHGTGYWVLTPLYTDTGFTVWINRGFVPPEKRDPVTRLDAQTKGSVRVTGLLRLSEPKGRILRRNDPAQDRWYSRDIATMSQKRGLSDTAPYFIDADATPNPGGWPLGGLTVVSFYNEHLVYAISWFALALMLLIRTIIAFRRKDV